MLYLCIYRNMNIYIYITNIYIRVQETHIVLKYPTNPKKVGWRNIYIYIYIYMYVYIYTYICIDR